MRGERRRSFTGLSARSRSVAPRVVGVSTGRTTAVFGVRAAIGGTERAALAVPPWDPLALATPVMPEGGRVAAAGARSWEGFCFDYF